MAAALAPTPWREQLLMQLLGYAAYHRAQDAAAAATSKPKAKPAAAAQTQQQQARGAAAGRADSRPLSTPPPPNGRCTCLIGPSPPPRPV
jgi:hypothetical protein